MFLLSALCECWQRRPAVVGLMNVTSSSCGKLALYAAQHGGFGSVVDMRADTLGPGRARFLAGGARGRGWLSTSLNLDLDSWTFYFFFLTRALFHIFKRRIVSGACKVQTRMADAC